MNKTNFCEKLKEAFSKFPDISVVRCSNGQGYLRFSVDFECDSLETIEITNQIIKPFNWKCVENTEALDSFEWSSTPYLLYSQSKGQAAAFEAGTIASRINSYLLTH